MTDQSIRDELSASIGEEMENWRGDSVAPEMSQLDYVAGSILASPAIRRIRAEAWNEGYAAREFELPSIEFIAQNPYIEQEGITP